MAQEVLSGHPQYKTLGPALPVQALQCTMWARIHGLDILLRLPFTPQRHRLHSPSTHHTPVGSGSRQDMTIRIIPWRPPLRRIHKLLMQALSRSLRCRWALIPTISMLWVISWMKGSLTSPWVWIRIRSSGLSILDDLDCTGFLTTVLSVICTRRGYDKVVSSRRLPLPRIPAPLQGATNLQGRSCYYANGTEAVFQATGDC